MTVRVVVTASSGTLSGLSGALSATPVEIEEHPLMSFAEPEDWAPLDRALDGLSRYCAVAVTSPRAAEVVASRLGARRPSGGVGAPLAWASGPATAAALGPALGPVRTPLDSETAKWGAAVALGRAMVEAGVSSPVLFPCGEVRRNELPERLRAAGIEVDEVVCYRSVLASQTAARTAAGRGSVLVVASPRVAELLAGACPPEQRPRLVAVGPTTADSARNAGWPPAAVASAPSVEAVASAVRSAIAQS